MELTSAERYFGSNTNDTTSPVGLQGWSYAFDNIGNRIGIMKANASANYTANSLNQYTERTVHGSSDIIGSAETNVTVTVNAEEAARQGYYWSHRLTVDNLFNPIYTQVVVEAICDPGTNAPYVVSSETGYWLAGRAPRAGGFRALTSLRKARQLGRSRAASPALPGRTRYERR